MDKWFSPHFLGSQVPVTYESIVTEINPFNGEREEFIQRDIIGFILVGNLPRFIEDMKRIQGEVKP